MRLFPRLDKMRDTQIRHTKAGQPSLRLGSTPSRAFITDFPPSPGGRTRERRNSRGMVMGLHLHQNMHWLLLVAILPLLRVEALSVSPPDHSSIIMIGREHIGAMVLVGVADHIEQRALLRLTIQQPIGTKDLMSTVLRVSLSKHHQLHVHRITS